MLLAIVILSTISTVSGVEKDSVEACQDKKVDDKCEFHLPTIDDRFSFPDIVPGEAETGVCQQRGVTLFCRAVPDKNQIAGCAGKSEGDPCVIQVPGRDTSIEVEAWTKTLRWADTKGAAYVSWKIDGVWTPPQRFFRGIRRGGSKKKTFTTRGWPTEVALTLNSNDAWGFWKITINGVVIIEDPEGQNGGERYCSYHPPISHRECPEFRMTKYWIEGPPATQFFDVLDYGTGDAKKGAQTVTVEAHTSVAERAGTTGCINIMFLIGGEWTTAEEGLEFFCKAELGEVKSKQFSVADWPTRVWIAINSTDAWGFWKLTMNDLTVIEDPAGMEASHEFDAMSHEFSDSSWWLESPPRTTTLKMPSRPSGLQQGNIHNQNGTCDTSWSGDFFCDDKQYVDRRPAEITTVREEGTWYVYTVFAVRGVNARAMDRESVDQFLRTIRSSVAEAAGEHIAAEDVVLTAEQNAQAVFVIASIELNMALQEKSGLTVDGMYSNLDDVGMKVKAALDKLEGMPTEFDLAVIDMGEVHESDIKEALDEGSGRQKVYQHNGKDCVRPSMTDQYVQGMMCSKDSGDGRFQKVCAWDPDESQSTLCTLEECETKCKGAEWCSAFSFSDYMGRQGQDGAKEQCFLFEKCFTMDDHDAYLTWPPSCVTPDPESTGRDNMKYRAPKDVNYIDVDTDADEEDDAPITVGGSAAGVIIGVVAAAVVCLLCAVVGLVIYVRRLRKKLETANRNPGGDVAIGRPVVQTADGPAGAVVGGIPVRNAGDEETGNPDKGAKAQAAEQAVAPPAGQLPAGELPAGLAAL